MAVPKVKSVSEWRHHSDVAHSFYSYRDRQALLRSVGHQYRDGRWTGEADDFHQYGVIESPGVGALRTMDGSTYWRNYSLGPIDTESHVIYNWKPVLGRYFTSEADTTYELTPPEITDPSFDDSIPELNFKGTDFIRRNRPGNPVASVGQLMLEMKQLPAIPLLQSKAKGLKRLGSEYLNIEFGWKPLVKDVQKIHRLQQSIKQRLNKLVKDNGLQRRKRSSKRLSTGGSTVAAGSLSKPFGHLGDISIGGSEVLEGYYCLGPFPYWDPSNDFTGSCQYEVIDSDSVEDWECGTFQYYVPDIGSDQWTNRAVRALYGADLTPDVLYSVYPWTWLFDWFWNVGDIISNLSSNAVDNEILSNSYSMRKKITTRKVVAEVDWDALDFAPYNPEFHFDIHAQVPAGREKLVYVYDTEEKLRHQATPFGFGIDMGTLTERQIAILAALLFTRKRPQLT